jgi:hypothetical protein
MMRNHKIYVSSVGADYDDEQNNPDTRRCRFIAPTADVSALAGFSGISLHVLITIIGPYRGLKRFIYYADFAVKATVMTTLFCAIAMLARLGGWIPKSVM